MDRGSELALVERLRRGDLSAFDAVYDAYRARLYAFLVRLSRRRDVADDLLEETWLRLVARARALRADTQLAAWLFTVARNLYWSHCRSRQVEEEHAGLIDIWPTAPAPPSPFESAAAHEFEKRLERALAQVSGRDREVLLLVAAEGLTPAEAAVVCGVTPEALRQRLARARSALEKVPSGAAQPARAARDEVQQ